MSVHTKIICTIGPSVNNQEKIIQLIEAGMNVARLNFSHGDHEEHYQTIQILKAARKKLGVSLAIMLDTKGPEIRIGKIKEKEIFLPSGQKWLLVKENILGDEHQITVHPPQILDQLKVGDIVLFNDGFISSHVIEVVPEGVLVRIEAGGMIRSGRGVNLPHIPVQLAAVTKDDIDDISFGCKQDIDWIAASFVRSPEHVIEIRKLLEKERKKDIKIIAKIENHEGVENIDGIIQIADGIMIARGDLGVEVPLSQVPKLQKMIIRKCYLAGKPSVTATQMLESMMLNSRPTRAEVSDVANAIYDSTSCVMLSGETAVGHYPIETVKVMRSIIEETESDFNYRSFFDSYTSVVYHDVPSSVTLSAVKTAYSSQAKAIFAFTTSGSTARLLSRLRPLMPIIAMTPSEKCYHQMALNWGVIPYLHNDVKSLEEAFKTLSDYALDLGYVSYGDLVIVTAGSSFGVSGTTNMMLVENIGEVLVRGHVGKGDAVLGNVVICLTPDSVKTYTVRGKILVIPQCDERFYPLVQEALGVILQNAVDDDRSENNLIEALKDLPTPYIFRADQATSILKEGQLITLDPSKGFVSKGVMI